MTWSDAGDRLVETAGSEGQKRTRRATRRVDLAVLKQEQRQRAPKSARLETLSVLVWMGGFNCG